MRKFGLLVGMVLIAGSCFAQIQIKPTAGLTFTDVSKDPDTGKAKSKVGYQLGASLMYGNKFYVEPGVFYGVKSTKFVDSDTNADDLDLDMKGLRIPVALGLHILGNEDSSLALRAFAGPSVFIVTGVDAEDAEKDDFESPTWGVFAGAGLDFWLMFLDVQYEWSLTDVSSITQFDVGKQRSFFVNLGVRIRL